MPSTGRITAAVLAAGKTATDVLEQIHLALGEPELPDSQPGDDASKPPDGAASQPPTKSDRFECMLSAVNAELARRNNATIVLDALDEASDPLGLLRELLSRLHDVRLVIGVRSTVNHENTSVCGSPEHRPLPEHVIDLLQAQHIIKADQAPYWQDSDLAAYISALVSHHMEATPSGTPAINILATAVARAVSPSYLAARIVSQRLAKLPTLPHPNDPHWRDITSSGLSGLLRDELTESFSAKPDRLRALTLLRAVAYAKGRGLPWLNVWPTMATAVANDGTSFGNDDIAWLLNHRLAGYLTRDTEDGITVYRLFHAALADALRQPPQTFLPEGDTP